jgi:aryl-alcohol dehydrogenase-like predicted oxidoreductase
MKLRKLGTQGLEVSAISLGCMGMSEFYGPTDEAEAIATIHRALELGVSMLDTADIYGYGDNERLVGKAVKGRRDRVVIATKFGILRKKDDPNYRGISGRPDYVRAACEASLARLGVDCIDLYYVHRVDAGVPIEDTVGAMADLVRSGKLRWIGLSEPTPATLRRAHAVHPISAVQTEYSLWSRDPERDLLPALRELGIGFVPYSPLGRGFLTGAIRSANDLAADDFRRGQPRFQGENLARNLAIADALRAIAQRLKVTPAQLALAWVLAQGGDMVPIPGTKRRKYLEENLAAADLHLSSADAAAIDLAVPREGVVGTRYADMSFVDRDSAPQARSSE